jgi:hypothetical protein
MLAPIILHLLRHISFCNSTAEKQPSPFKQSGSIRAIFHLLTLCLLKEKGSELTVVVSISLIKLHLQLF